MNKVYLAGRLTRKPELKQTKNGKNVSDFSLALNRGTKDEDGNEQVDFINCRCWNKVAENLCKYQDKGSFVIVEGSIRVDSYNDKNGDLKYTTYIMVENIEFTPKQTSKKQEQPKQEQSVDNWDAGKNVEIDDDMLPFYN